jgi:hypothetical protein
MFWMRAYPLRGQVGGGWFLEIESFLGPEVASALCCCTAVPGSKPARHAYLGLAWCNLFAQMQESRTGTQLRKKEHPAGEHPEEE